MHTYTSPHHTHTHTHTQDDERWSLVTAGEERGSVKIAAIDNGLAFPFKHPDEWRTCKFENLDRIT